MRLPVPTTSPAFVTVPVNVGLAKLAFRLSAVVANAVVATLVVLSAADCVVAIVPVGKVGVPVNVGDANGAYALKSVPEIGPGIS